MPVSIGSIRLRLERVPSAAPHIEALAVEGIHWPRQLQRTLNDSDRRLALQEKLNCTNKQLVAMRNELDLYLFKGIGSRHGELLQLAGINTIEDLAPWTPDGLHDELSRLAKSSGVTIPREDWVRVWVLASRSRGVLMSNGTQ